MDLTTDALIAFAKACLDAGAHIVQAGDSLASLDMISPAMYRTWAWPAEQRFFAEVNPLAKRQGAATLLHICGNMTRVLESMADTGADPGTGLQGGFADGPATRRPTGLLDGQPRSGGIALAGDANCGRPCGPASHRRRGSGGRVHPGIGLRSARGGAPGESPSPSSRLLARRPRHRHLDRLRRTKDPLARSARIGFSRTKSASSYGGGVVARQCMVPRAS